MTADQLALNILLADIPEDTRQDRLTALTKTVRPATGSECPECGHEDTEDNGCSGSRIEFRCCSCDHRWGPGSET